MSELWQRLKQRKLVQWAVAYVAAAFALLQGVDIVAQRFGWPESIERFLIIAACVGFFVALVLAWYHGERGEQRVSTTELMILAMLLAIGGGLLWRYARVSPQIATMDHDSIASDVRPNNKSIAVLPFENLSSDKDNAYFADGIQDQILTGLSKIGDLKVISRTSTQRYASRPDNIAEIAKQLGVANILEGSVQKAGNRVRINVQLIRTDNDTHLWAETYDRSLDDIFAVQSEVAQKIAESLAANLTRDERAALAQKPTQNTAAYASYLKARALNTGVVASRVQADTILGAYREAVTLDPDFALAWAELARECFRTYWIGMDASGALRKEGESALARARQLAPNLPQTQLAQAVYLYYVKLDFAGAMAAMEPVNKALPGYADGWLFSGFLARRLGRWEEAASSLEHARLLAPKDAVLAYHLGVTYVSMRQCDRAMPSLDASLQLQPDNSAALWVKLQCAWVDADMVRADRMLADEPLQTSGFTALRAEQALFKRDYTHASALYRRAIDNAGDLQSDSGFNGYISATVGWRLQLALSEQHAGKMAVAQALYAQVKADATTKLANKPDNAYVAASWHAALGIALAGLGEHQAANEQAALVTSLVPASKDALEGPAYADYVARIYALNGDATRAVPLLRHQLKTFSSVLGAGYLQIDPDYDSIRNNPGFQALLKGERL